MKVLFAITKGEVGGAQAHIRILAAGLMSRGWSVGILTEPRSRLAAELRDLGADLHDWPHITRNPHPTNDVRARRELRTVLQIERPDVLHLHSSKAGTLGRGLTGGTETATIYTCHHAAFGPGRQWSHRVSARPIEQVTLPLVDGIISVGARDVPLLSKIARAVPVEVIRNAVDVPPRPLGAPPGTPTAIWVARLKRPKRIDVAIKVWERVVEQRADARLIICGSGPLEANARDLASRSSARDNIEVLGFVADLDKIYAQASVFFLSSMAEGGLTMATLEAMTHGLIPVVSDVGDASLLLIERAGFVAMRNDVRSHAAAVLQAFAHRDAAEISKRAMTYSTTRWSTTDMVAATVSFYEQVIDARHRG